jgi:hypothetical protein
MQSGRGTPESKPVPLKTILRKLGAPKKSEIPRWLLSGKASRRLEEIQRQTGISKEVLSDAAIDALHAALANKPSPRGVRDAKLREWLNRGETV